MVDELVGIKIQLYALITPFTKSLILVCGISSFMSIVLPLIPWGATVHSNDIVYGVETFAVNVLYPYDTWSPLVNT